MERTDIDQKTRFGYDAGQNRVAKAVIDVSATDTLYSYYVRDAQGNVMAVYERQEDTLIWREQHLYGSARLGILQPGVRWYPGNMPTPNPYFTDTTTLHEGWKYYEITNHLGNVMATINDRKAQFDTDSDDVADYYEAAVMTATDYFPFGASMRQYQANGYRYGFNGKETEHDGEFAATVHYDYGFRVYHPAVGRFLSVDPLMKGYPSWTPYAFAMNRPIDGVDLDGLEWKSEHKWSDKINSNQLKVIYGDAIVGKTTRTLFGMPLYSRSVEAWEEKIGTTYKDLWRESVPGLQQKYFDQQARIDCADFCFQILSEFAFTHKLPVSFKDYLDKPAPFISNDNYGYEKNNNFVPLSDGDWQGFSDALGAHYGAVHIWAEYSLMTKTKGTFLNGEKKSGDFDSMLPGDLTAFRWKSGSFHAQTIGHVYGDQTNNSTRFSLINASSSSVEGAPPPIVGRRSYLLSDMFNNKNIYPWNDAIGFKLREWDFDFFDKNSGK